MVAVLATIVKIILAIILPPVAVFLEVGEARVLCFFDVSGAGLAHRREKRLPFISPSPRFLFLSLLHPPPPPPPPPPGARRGGPKMEQHPPTLEQRPGHPILAQPPPHPAILASRCGPRNLAHPCRSRPVEGEFLCFCSWANPAETRACLFGFGGAICVGGPTLALCACAGLG